MIIYKYLPPESALKTVKNNSVLLRCPTEYNDPFDCLLYVSDEEREAAFKLFLNFTLFETFYREMITKNKKFIPNKLDAKEVRETVRLIGKEIKKTRNYVINEEIAKLYSFASKLTHKNDSELRVQFNATINDVLVKMRGRLLASCFSLKNDSLLMWSHYAYNHKGACIEFEIDDHDFKPVSYSKNFPTFELAKLLGIIFAHRFLKEEIDYEKEEYQFALRPILTKADVWSYEAEVRCVYSKNKPNERILSGENGCKLLKMPPIKRIIVGCNAEEEFVRKMVEASDGIPVERMRRADDEYSIVIEKKP